MVKCAQNRTLSKTEKTKGVNPSWSTDEQAQTGSTIFFRQHRQLAAQGVSVQMSRDMPFKYSPVTNEAVWESAEESDGEAHQMNCLAKWTMKQDRFDKKSINFWHQLKKYGNIPIGISQKRTIERKFIQEPVIEERLDPETGEVYPVEVDINERTEEFVTANYPTLTIYNVDAVYADIFIGDLQRQDCVLLPSLLTKSDLWQKVADDEYSEEQVKKIEKKDRWDGDTAKPLKTERVENNDQSSPDERVTDQWLVWDIFIRAPIDKGKWDEESQRSDLYYLTVVGNDIENAIPVRLEENQDPDGEIPIYMIHDLPDDGDVLYHLSPAQIVRSNYSVECTLKNQMIDNNSNVNNAPLIEVEGMVRGVDRKYGKNTVFTVDDIGAIKEFDARDLSQSNMAFTEYIKNDTKESLSTVSNILGEAYGGRTSALEASNAYKNSVQPHMVAVRYVLEQFLYIYAKKIRSYWGKYALPGQVAQITDENQIRKIRPEEIEGDFDIEIDIVDQFEDDVVQNQRIFEALNLIGGNPELAKHVNLGNLLAEWFKQAKFDHTKLVKKPSDYDARELARQENATLMSGNPASVKPGEDSAAHLIEHEGERLRYKGVEDQFPNVVLLDRHIAETKFAVQQEGQSQGTPPAPSGNQGPGEAQGNEIAGALGAQVPQGA